MFVKRLNEWWQRFRQWQHKPFRYKPLTDERHVCQNCGQEFAGDYCPRCSQSAKVSDRLGWDTVRDTVMEIFDLESRSFPRTLWHLLWRPGFLIDDYISGRRQSSYPPMKTLLLVALCLVFMDKLSEWMGWEEAAETVNAAAVDDNVGSMADSIWIWVENNPGLGILALNCLFIWPTWLLFRYAPRHTRHSLPEGFFIQVFMSTLILLILIISYCFSNWIFGVILLYYVLAYRQLFGYGLWGTLWRIVVGLFEMLMMTTIVIFMVNMCRSIPNLDKGQSIAAEIIAAVLIVTVGVIVAVVAQKINKKSYHG